MSNYNITGWSAGGRQSLTYSLKAAQKRGMGRANVYTNNIYIFNNCEGPRRKPTIVKCCNENKPSLLEKIATGTGVLALIAGFALNCLGGSAEGAGDSGEKAKVSEEAKPEAEVKPEAEAKPEISVRQKQENDEVAKIKEYASFADGLKMRCKDASGNTQDIYGTLSNVVKDANGVPQSFTLTDDVSGNKYNYTCTKDSNGNITYQCTSKNGQETVGAPTYSLQNGELVNLDGQNGYGIGIHTTSTPEGTGGTKNNVNRGTVNNSGNNTTPTGVPYKNLNSYESISDPSVRGNAKLVNDAINKLPQNQRATFSTELNKIIEDFGNSNDFGTKMTTNQKLTALLNKINQGQDTTPSKQTQTTDPNKPFIGSRQPWL